MAVRNARPGPAVLASDAERDQLAAQLQHHYATGRLTLPELEERVAAACEARTREQLDVLVSDLPAKVKEAATSVDVADFVDFRLLIILLCSAPPAALVYWLLCQRAASRYRVAQVQALEAGNET